MEINENNTCFATNSMKKVWCCDWGLLESAEMITTIDSSSDDEDGSETFSQVNLDRYKEFIITGGSEPKLRIMHISPKQDYVFPYEYSHDLPGRTGIHYLAVSPDSRCIAGVTIDGNLLLLDIKNGVRLPNVTHSVVSNYWSTAFGGSNDCVYAGSGGGKIYKYDTTLGKLQIAFDTHRCENIMSMAISQDHRLLASCDFGGNFTLIDGHTGQLLRRLHYGTPLRRIVFDANTTQAFMACDDKTIKLLDLPSGLFRENLKGHDAHVMSVAASADGQRVVSGAFDGSIRIWDIRSTKCAISFLSAHNFNLWDVAFNRRSNKISFVGDGKGLKIYYCLGNREMLLF